MDKAVDYYEASLNVIDNIYKCQSYEVSINFDDNIHENRGEFDDALEFYKNCDKSIQTYVSLSRIGDVYKDKMDWDNAIKYYIIAKEIVQKLDKSDEIHLISDKINNLYKHEVKKGTENYEDLINNKTNKENKAKNSSVQISQNSTKLSKEINNFNIQSNEVFDQAELDLTQVISESLYIFDKVYANNNKAWYELKQYCKRCLETFNQTKSRKELYIPMIVLGNLYSKQKNFETSIFCYEESLKISIELNDTKLKINSMMTLANIYEIIGKWKNSLKYLGKCIYLSRTINDYKIRLNIIRKIGNLYLNQRVWDKSLKNYKLSLKISKINEDKNEELQSLKKLETYIVILVIWMKRSRVIKKVRI
ncbi:MAG: hypothetical protein NHB15_03200 [Methanosarcina barkeri]|nr:hypothetical protein [Methanosarcina sp. ERenArc_MAG2]